MRQSVKALIGILLLVLYTGGYAVARQAAWIVHRAGFHTDTTGRMLLAMHDVVPGDVGVPMLAPVAATAQGVVAVLYLPARKLEVLYWDFRLPQGSPWPSEYHHHH